MKSLRDLAIDAKETVESGYYNVDQKLWSQTRPSNLVQAIRNRRGNAIVCEIKFASPSAGRIRNYGAPSDIAREMEAGGATALSILTEPKNFNGSIQNLVDARSQSQLPLIMKDIVVSKEQIAAASRIGASAVLFIEEVFTDGLTMDLLTLPAAVEMASRLGLDTIIESHTKQGFETAYTTKCDIAGINNRDLRTFETTIETTVRLLGSMTKENRNNHLIMSESGFEGPEDIKKIREELAGHPMPDAYLIGTSVMKSNDVTSTVRSFVEA